MSFQQVRITGFRCLAGVSLAPDPELNRVTGPNASGKTSLLEALYYLGRGRSFRASGNRELIREGTDGFTLFAEVAARDGVHRIGIEAGGGQRRIRIDGETATGAELARLLPVQAIDPEIHNLVQGGPEIRRRFLDWGVFHVKHEFLDAWRRYQQALKQRNATLRHGEPDANVAAWDGALIAAGEAVNRCRREYLDSFMSLFDSIKHENLPFDSICSYRRGWPEETSLAEALAASHDRDRLMQSTQVGPHRADLQLRIRDRRARYRVSRGQQKLLAATLSITQVCHAAAAGLEGLVLLVDDPSAELDRDNRERLFRMLEQVPGQLFVTALEAADLPWQERGLRFHVEHGELSSLL